MRCKLSRRSHREAVGLRSLARPLDDSILASSLPVLRFENVWIALPIISHAGLASGPWHQMRLVSGSGKGGLPARHSAPSLTRAGSSDQLEL